MSTTTMPAGGTDNSRARESSAASPAQDRVPAPAAVFGARA